jgi:hypothetical protein
MVLENFGLNFMTSMQLFTNFGILRQFLAFKEYENLKEKIKSATQRVLAREPTGNGPHGLPDPAAGFFSSPTDADELGPRWRRCDGPPVPAPPAARQQTSTTTSMGAAQLLHFAVQGS